MAGPPLKRSNLTEAGTTIIEFLVATAAASVVLLGAAGLFVALSQLYQTEEQVARMLQKAQAALNLISRDVRAAGLGGLLPYEIVATSPPCLVGPFPLFQATNTPPVLTIRQLLDDPAAATQLAPPPPAGQSQTSAVLRVDSTAGFARGDRALITDRTRWSLFTVTQVIGGANPGLQHNPSEDCNSPGGFGYAYPAIASKVIRLQPTTTITYAIDTTDPRHPTLTRNAGGGLVRLIPDLETFAVRYTLQDGTVVSNPATVTTAAQAAQIRVITLQLTVRAERPDPRVPGDGYRRQTLTTQIKVRNLP